MKPEKKDPQASPEKRHRVEIDPTRTESIEIPDPPVPNRAPTEMCLDGRSVSDTPAVD